MTIDEFNKTKWGYGAVVYLIENKIRVCNDIKQSLPQIETYDVHSVDFEDKTICIEDDSVTRWVHCEECELVRSKK